MAEAPSTIHEIIRGEATYESYAPYLRRCSRLVEDFVGVHQSTVLPRQAIEIASQMFGAIVPTNWDELPESEHRLRGYIFTCLALPWSRPEWFLPLGFDQMRFGAEKPMDTGLSSSAEGVFEEYIGKGLAETDLSSKTKMELHRLISLVVHAPQFRTPNGAWHSLEFVYDKLLPPQEEPDEGETRSFDEWISLLADSWVSSLEMKQMPTETTLFMPALWTPLTNYSEIRLQRSVQDILQAIVREKQTLRDLHWRTFEELVAELLHDSGLQVELTPRSGDGGRDIIARGELLPGEPTVLAIEVKQKAVVPISDVRAALWANRQFPALLLATSGRFSAGVYRERGRDLQSLRLYLKDGVALGQWIDDYAKRHQL